MSGAKMKFACRKLFGKCLPASSYSQYSHMVCITWQNPKQTQDINDIGTHTHVYDLNVGGTNPSNKKEFYFM